MIRLLYISDAADDINEDSLTGVLKSAEKNNPSLGITGLLVFGGGVFAQILEGPDQAVLQKYVEIATDSRHQNCRVVYITTNPPTQKKARTNRAFKLAWPAREGAAHDKPQCQYSFSIVGGV